MDANNDEARSYVFVTPGWKTSARKFLVLIHGNGAPRAGEWARRYVVQIILSREPSFEFFCILTSFNNARVLFTNLELFTKF